MSLRNGTAGRRGRQIAFAWQTWQGYNLRVLLWSWLTSMFSGLLSKDLFKRKGSLAKSYFKQNYCHACHTMFAVFFPLPSCCVSSLVNWIAAYPRTARSMAIAVTREIFLGDYTLCKQVLCVGKFSYPPPLLASFLYQLTLCLSQNFLSMAIWTWNNGHKVSVSNVPNSSFKSVNDIVCFWTPGRDFHAFWRKYLPANRTFWCLFPL